jgi:hypothetical protein
MARFTERLSVPWWGWPVAVAASAMLAAELAIGSLALRHPLTFIIAGAVAVLGLALLSRIRVRVTDTEFHVDDARLPLEVIDSVHVIDAAQRRDLLGLDADPLAFVIQRPWIGGGVRVDLNDPSDPTPYWYISSRRPAELAAALTTAAGN